METKRCNKCEVEKPVSEFGLRKPGTFRYGSCKACERVRAAVYHRGPAKTDRNREWQRRNPEKRAAHKAVEAALLNGALVRQPCERCGNPNAHAHHDDYSKPLEVRWLCHRDHMARHREIRALEGKHSLTMPAEPEPDDRSRA